MIYTIFGGINGVGKTTIFDLLSEEEKSQLGIRLAVQWSSSCGQLKLFRWLSKLKRSCIK